MALATNESCGQTAANYQEENVMAADHTDGPWIDTVETEGEDKLAHILAVQSLHPEGLAAHRAHYRAIMFGKSPLSRAEREAIAVVVSAVNDCFY